MNPSDPQGSPVFAKPIVWVVAGDSTINKVSFASNGFILAFDFLEPLEVSFVNENGVDKEDYNDGEVRLHINFQTF